MKVDHAYSEPCQRALFNHIQTYSEPCEKLAYAETGIFKILEYSEPDIYSETCYIYENLRIFRTLTYLKSVTYSEPSQRFRMEYFAKIVKDYNHFSKALHLRSLTGFWSSFNKYSLIIISINTNRPSFNKYSLTCGVSPRIVLYEKYSEPCLLS